MSNQEHSEEQDNWDYLAPYIGFLLIAQISGLFPEGQGWAYLLIRILVPLSALYWFWKRGAYPELKEWKNPTSDIIVGIALAAMWMAPFILFPSLRPGPEEHPLMGPGSSLLDLSLRLFGFAVMTPLVEELFIRSFLMRFAQVYTERGDFRQQPIGIYTWQSFLVTSLIFTTTHVVWEWWVAIPWIMLTNLWFYRRRNVWSLIILHAATNAAIFFAVVFNPTDWDLWYFL